MPDVGESLTVAVGVQCHPGKIRTENQDRITRAATPFGDLYLLADGVAGYGGGAEAAESTITEFARKLCESISLPAEEALASTAQFVSRLLASRGLLQDPPARMSSTVVLALVQGSRALVGHIGDSRAYLVRHGALQQITRDHSVLQRLIDEGKVQPIDARNHPSASMLTQALGQTTEVTLAITELPLHPGDALLLCSDGLWGYAFDWEIAAIAAAYDLSPAACAEALLHLALDGGGGDNISIQYLRFSAPVPQLRVRTLYGLPLSAAILLLLALSATLAIAVGLTLWNHWHGALHFPNFAS